MVPQPRRFHPLMPDYDAIQHYEVAHATWAVVRHYLAPLGFEFQEELPHPLHPLDINTCFGLRLSVWWCRVVLQTPWGALSAENSMEVEARQLEQKLAEASIKVTYLGGPSCETTRVDYAVLNLGAGRELPMYWQVAYPRDRLLVAPHVNHERWRAMATELQAHQEQPA